jgi:hypothetical protein
MCRYWDTASADFLCDTPISILREQVKMLLVGRSTGCCTSDPATKVQDIAPRVLATAALVGATVRQCRLPWFGTNGRKTSSASCLQGWRLTVCSFGSGLCISEISRNRNLEDVYRWLCSSDGKYSARFAAVDAILKKWSDSQMQNLHEAYS